MLPMIAPILNGISSLWSSIVGNRAEKNQQKHQEQIAAYNSRDVVIKQFAAEFMSPGSGFFDSMINGLNRLPRPFITFALIGLLVWVPLYPQEALIRLEVLTLMPPWIENLIYIVVSFWFGGRITHKFSESRFDKQKMEMMTRLMERTDKFSATQSLSPSQQNKPASLSVWQKQRQKKETASSSEGVRPLW